MFMGLFLARGFSSKVNPYSVLNLFKLKPVNEEVKVLGWLKSQRKQSKELSFLHISDGSTIKSLQIVVPKSTSTEKFAYHACLSIEGKIVESRGAKQDIELLADKIEVVSPGAPVDYPFIERGDYLEEDIRLQPQFRPRTKNFASILRVRSKTKASIRKYFESENFINIDTPILTRNSCEGGSDPFLVRGHGEMFKYDTEAKVHESVFGHPVYLTVSGQLHLEAMASGLSKVYNFNPAFRGESGSRHLHEFWMVEMEEAFLEKKEGFDALVDRLEKFVKFTIEDVMKNSAEDVEFLWKFNNREDDLKETIARLLETPFVKMKFKDAIDILKEKGISNSSDGEGGLNKRSEIFLTEHLGNAAIFITDWPKRLKPFYMYSFIEEEEEIARGMDLLLPFVGEVAGGGLREYRFAILRKNIEALDKADELQWYLYLRKFGHAPSGGFGLGLERFLQFLLGISNINDTIPFARSRGRCLL